MLSKLYSDYCDWIGQNPIEAADYETIFKWGSLLLSGRTTSAVIPELMYAISNLITLHNDLVVLKTNTLLKSGSNIKIWLSALEYCEVFLELSASKFGDKKKLSVIFLVQLIKCTARIYLLHFCRGSLISNPPLLPVERFTFKNKQLQQNNLATTSGDVSRMIRNIPKRRKSEKYASSHRKYLAEVIFSTKPIFHLGASLLFGHKSWKPFILSMCMDAVSLILHTQEHKQQRLSSEDALVISQRHIKLLLYFMRSPFYDKHFKALMILMFNKLFENLSSDDGIADPESSLAE